MEKKMATKYPSRKLQMITFNIQPKHSYVNKNLHVAQPEVGINISLSDKGDIIEFSVFY
jgi:hypothetical protein